MKMPSSCKSPFEVTCLRMEEKLAYSKTEQVVLIITFYANLLHAGLPLISLVSDIMLLHHEVVVDYPDDHAETHRSTLLAMGRTESGKTTMAMALTVGIPAATGALVFFYLIFA